MERRLTLIKLSTAYREGFHYRGQDPPLTQWHRWTHMKRAREAQASHGFTQTLTKISAWKNFFYQKWETSYSNTSKFEQRPKQFPQRPQESNTVKIKSSHSKWSTDIIQSAGNGHFKINIGCDDHLPLKQHQLLALVDSLVLGHQENVNKRKHVFSPLFLTTKYSLRTQNHDVFMLIYWP